MKFKRIAVFVIFAALVVMMAVTSRTGFTQEKDDYVSSNPKGCNLCHKLEAELWLKHGHSKMLRPVENGKTPDGITVNLPEGMTWNDISYLIGGDKNYARFTDAKGYVVTGQNAQYSLVGKTLTPYMPDVPKGTLKYSDCMRCHVVGWKESGTYVNGVKNNLEGISGVWFENSVGCEACHGPGHEHAALGPKNMQEMRKKDKKADLKITINKTSELCGQCHKCNNDDKINVAAPTLVENNQQYTEMRLNKKGKFKVTCIYCHNPHATSRDKSGLVRQCTDCHTGKQAKPVKIAAMSGLPCVACHMPLADRGAYDTKVQGYTKGDTRSHIFGITTDPNYKLDDGTGHATIDSNGFVRLTVEMTCFQCHQSGGAPEKSREELLEKAKLVHAE